MCKDQVLYIKFQTELNVLNFNYIHYKVEAKNYKEAMKKGCVSYMNDERGEFIEELPILLKFFAQKQLCSFKIFSQNQ